MKITTNKDQIRSLSQILSPANFKRILREKDYSSTLYRLERYISIGAEDTNLDLINEIYSSLLKNYRNEYVYKNILINRMLLKKYSLSTTVAFNEFKIGNSIADFVLLNGESKVYEIKTELDNLNKIDKQLIDYCKFSDKVYVVASSKHIHKLMSLLNNTNIGIIELTVRNALNTIKEAESNSSNFDHEILFKTLRKAEYLELIFDYFSAIPSVPNTKIFKECLNLSKTIEIELFQKLVIAKLKKRNIANKEIIKEKVVPESLKHICYTLDLSKSEYNELDLFLGKNCKSCISHTSEANSSN
jgi:hypothetical protein